MATNKLSNDAPFWNPKLKALHRELKKLDRRQQKYRDDEVAKVLFREKRTEYRRELKYAKRQHWKKFSSEVQNCKDMAKLFKIIHRQQTEQIGLMRQDTPEEAVKLLLDTHFPGSEKYSGLGDVSLISCSQEELVKSQEVSFVTIEKVKTAFNQFEEGKAAGPDNFKPEIFHKLPDVWLQFVVNLFKACILTGYTPKIWSIARVVFIPKHGKDDYSDPGAYRPISLATCLLKALERVVLWEIEEKYMSVNPLSQDQHAFRKGSSCDSALSQLINRIEKAIMNGNYALGVFLDIKGAFDNIDLCAIEGSFHKRGISKVLCNWYVNYTRNRAISVEIRGQKEERRLTRGVPQGGVLSPLAWNILFDSFLALFKGPVYVTGFADDAAFVAFAATAVTVTTAVTARTLLGCWSLFCGLSGRHSCWSLIGCWSFCCGLIGC